MKAEMAIPVSISNLFITVTVLLNKPTLTLANVVSLGGDHPSDGETQPEAKIERCGIDIVRGEKTKDLDPTKHQDLGH